MEVLLALAWMLAVGLLKVYRWWDIRHQQTVAFVKGRKESP